MKKIIFLGAFAIGLTSVFSQELKLGSEFIDLGTIKLNSQVTAKMKVTNVGSADLLLKSIQGSCSCTVPEYPKTPIKPGQSVDITIKYDAGSIAEEFNKSVTINSNDVNASRKIFRVKGKAQ